MAERRKGSIYTRCLNRDSPDLECCQKGIRLSSINRPRSPGSFRPLYNSSQQLGRPWPQNILSARGWRETPVEDISCPLSLVGEGF
ncbi:unnamed protein product [Mycena citricolor]|uniref:Uncharacterized protein n=1 Tax=Mycena citricolor TaxID=2018698 RepID=A0AAD2K0G9_9AGAR|nr:unnamed protein product [Mycena citricolor]